MNEILQDYYEHLHEQNLTRHKGYTSKPRPSYRAVAKPCKVTQAEKENPMGIPTGPNPTVPESLPSK